MVKAIDVRSDKQPTASAFLHTVIVRGKLFFSSFHKIAEFTERAQRVQYNTRS